MSDQWHDNNVLSGHAQADDDDPPDDWETALEEKVSSLHIYILVFKLFSLA